MALLNFKQSSKKHPDPEEMTFWDHLDEFRGVIIRGIIAIVVIGILAFTFKGILFDYIILAPKSSDFITYRVLCKLGKMLSIDSFCLEPSTINLINIELAGQFMAHMMIALIAGLVVAIPYIIFEMWRFVSPGLTQKERDNTRGVVFIVSALFLVGILFSYFLVVPLMVNFLGNYQVSESVVNTISLTSYTSSVTTLTLLMGLIFEFPVVVVFLTKIGIVTPMLLKTYRKHTLVIIFIVAGLITPSPDIFSQLIVAIPLYGLFEISIVVSKRIYKRKELEEDAG
jgi:sec-independent protein translocase protein TatC